MLGFQFSCSMPMPCSNYPCTRIQPKIYMFVQVLVFTCTSVIAWKIFAASVFRDRNSRLLSFLSFKKVLMVIGNGNVYLRRIMRVTREARVSYISNLRSALSSTSRYGRVAISSWSQKSRGTLVLAVGTSRLTVSAELYTKIH